MNALIDAALARQRMVLTALVLADELFDMRDGVQVAKPAAKDEETAVLKLLEQVTRRIDGIASRVQSA